MYTDKFCKWQETLQTKAHVTAKSKDSKHYLHSSYCLERVKPEKNLGTSWESNPRTSEVWPIFNQPRDTSCHRIGRSCEFRT